MPAPVVRETAETAARLALLRVHECLDETIQLQRAVDEFVHWVSTYGEELIRVGRDPAAIDSERSRAEWTERMEAVRIAVEAVGRQCATLARGAGTGWRLWRR